jgi:CBS domain containing-hemolysin-like protein
MSGQPADASSATLAPLASAGTATDAGQAQAGAPERAPPAAAETAAPTAAEPSLADVVRRWLKTLGRPLAGESSVPDALQELIEERSEGEAPISDHEWRLVANVLALRGRTVSDVRVPRADVVGIEIGTPLAEVVAAMTKEGHSRLPVFRETLDDATGMVHIKDVLAWRGRDEEFQLSKIQRKVLFVAPSMRVLELLLEMRVKRCHMALVVDEFGGVDGLVTIEDLVEEIVGEIEDEHDRPEEPDLKALPDGAFDADARLPVEELEEKLGLFLADEERENVDTVGGLVASLAGRVPIRGELIRHPSGLEFEVLDADPRRVKRLRLRRGKPKAARGKRPPAGRPPGA